MKRTLLTAITITLAISASAVVGGPEPGEGELAITSSGSTSSSTTAVGPNGTEYSSTIKMTGTNSNISIGENVENISYSGDQVNFTGHIQSPTPCHVLEQETERIKEDSYRINIHTVNNQDNQSACTKQTIMIKYQGTFEAEKPYTLEIRHKNQTIDTIEIPEITKQDPKEDREKGLIKGFMNWFGNLF